LLEKIKVRFSMNMGTQTCSVEEVFTLKELGYDDNKDEMEKFLDEKWKVWAMDKLDGGYDWEV